MAELPTGTVTFLYTDIEGSTARWERAPAAMQRAVERHLTLLRAAITAHQGQVFRTVGDGLCAAFARAPDAVAAALVAQRSLLAEPWGELGVLSVRLVLHTAVADHQDGDYVGAGLNRLGRLLAIGHGGQVLLSSGVQPLVRDALPPDAGLRDLGEHRLRDLIQPERVYQVLHPDLPADFPPLRSLDAYPHNLPLQLTSFVGREAEMAEVARLLTTTRLLTLTGTGGCGKTRLALQVAADLVDAYPDGIWLVELAPLADPILVVQTVAVTLGVREQPGQLILTTLLAVLKAKRLLLLLDNCEHLLDACARLADPLLRGCPGVRILATSREALGIAGEVSWRAPSLAMPATADDLTPADVLHYEAVRLFVERARAVQPGFHPTAEQLPAIVQICRRLDGIPLAIELAAARVTGLSLEQVATRLDQRFRLLTGGSRTALPRQQTLRAAIDWSYALLSAPEQALLRRLSVCNGGCTLEAAEAVCAGEGLDEAEVLDLLLRLIAKSLVQAEPGLGGETRYRLLETVRQYARDHLLDTGEVGKIRQRHLDWHLALVERAAPHLIGPRQGVWLNRLETEHDNIRAALEWASAEPDGAEAALRLAGAMGRYWAWRAYAHEGLRLLRAALARREEAAPAAVRAAVMEAMVLAGWAEDPGFTALTAECLALSRAHGDGHGTSVALQNSALGLFPEGNLAGALRALEEAVTVARAVGDRRDVASALRLMAGIHLHQGADMVAEPLLDESLAIGRTLREPMSICGLLVQLSVIALHRGEPARSRLLLEEALPLATELSHMGPLGSILITLGDVARVEGDSAGAWTHYRHCLRLLRERHLHEYSRHVTRCLSRCAGLLAQAGRAEAAARLAGAATALVRPAFDARDSVLWSEVYTPAEHARALAPARAALGEAAFAAAWAAGQALTLEEAVAEALAEEPVG